MSQLRKQELTQRVSVLTNRQPQEFGIQNSGIEAQYTIFSPSADSSDEFQNLDCAIVTQALGHNMTGNIISILAGVGINPTVGNTISQVYGCLMQSGNEGTGNVTDIVNYYSVLTNADTGTLTSG